MNDRPEPQEGCDRHNPGKLSVEQARAHVMAQLTPVATIEQVAVRDGLDRILGEDIMASIDVPAHTNSAMDGYAIRGADLPDEGTADFRRIGESFAGHPYAGVVGKRECVRIMTGGVMPDGADTVIIQEDVTGEGSTIGIGSGHKPGQHVRQAGEDLAQGERVLEAGRRLTAADLGLLASVGVAEVGVHRRLRVAFLSTGDELRSLGQPLGEGDIYDSNRYTLYGMLSRFGAAILDFGVVRDEPEALRTAFLRAGKDADVVIASGGASVGEADLVRSILNETGRIVFQKVNMKPGKPVAFGHLDGGAVFFGLPGNPVSTMVTYYQIVQPALDYLAGSEPRKPVTLQAETIQQLRKQPGRREFQRGYVETNQHGRLTVRPAAPQGSGILRSMSLANCFIVLPEESGPVAAGETVCVELFAGLV